MEKSYTNKDLENSLRRAFVDNRFESILFDGHESRSPYKRAGISYEINQDWLKVDSQVNESQYTVVNYSLTEKGKKHFGLAKS